MSEDRGPQVRVGIIGVGNCARALIEGTAYYHGEPDVSAGLMHHRIGPYESDAIQPAIAFDVDREKVGLDVVDAISKGRNLDVGIKASEVDLDELRGGKVFRGPTLDGIGSQYRERITLADDHPNLNGEEVVRLIREAKVDVLLNYLPVGSQAATEWWAQVAIDAGCAFVNNVPVFIARREVWRKSFREAGLPLIGDDIKSQLGATYLHRLLVRAFSDRGITLDRTYQENFGGNMDFANMLEDSRLETKRESKTSAVTDAYDGELDPSNVHIGPSGYISFLGDTKKAFIRCEGRGFAGAPISFDVNLVVPDSPNSAGVVIDAARIAKLAMDRGEVEVDKFVSAWLFKAPPREVSAVTDDEAMHRLDKWIEQRPVTLGVAEHDAQPGGSVTIRLQGGPAVVPDAERQAELRRSARNDAPAAE